MLKQQPGSLWFRLHPHTAIRELPGIGSKLSKRVIEDLGDGDAHIALVTVERNPFTLTEVEGIGFKKADRIAREAFAVGPDDVRRHEAGNRYILEQRGVLNEREFFAERVKLELRDQDHKLQGVEIEDDLYWLPSELEAEKGLEGWLRTLPAAPAVLPELTPAQLAVCTRNELDDVQTSAVRLTLSGVPAVALTGGAGCGKTHVVAAVGEAVTVTGKTMRGMAFAGKAADRMREAFARYGLMAEATTIHKALGFMKGGFTVDVLSEDVIVIDESSMLPNWLLWAVVRRLKPGAILILVGDPNQLPPIGYGTPFVDAIAHGIPRAHLSRNYRQAGQQGILHMAEGILHRQRATPAECVEMHLGVDGTNIDALFDDLIRQHGGRDYEAWQVITYQNENAERYNLRAQAIINPDGRPLFEYPLWKLGTGERGRPKYHAEVREGDKVIVVKNNSTLEIFNGQTGRVVGLTNKTKVVQRKNSVTGRWEEQQGEFMPHLIVEITGRDVAIPEDELEKHIQLGYVITVHKAQGSDWNRVLVMQPGKVRDDTARKFFYTAVTRAKDHLVIVSAQRVVGWWTNATTETPEVPSSLMRRLSRPAPEPVCSWCLDSGEPCACNAGQNDYQPEPGPEFQPTLDALSLEAPLLPSEWDEVRRAHPVRVTEPTDSAPLTVEPAAQRDDVVSAPAPQVWRTLRQSSVAETPAPDHIEALKAQFKTMEVA
jgi:exodeoxyribonuclease V alpha subunit